MGYAKIYDTPRGMRLYHWLRKEPVPVRCVGTTADDQEISVAVTPGGRGSSKWKDTIIALYECVKVTARNENGDILRTLALDPIGAIGQLERDGGGRLDAQEAVGDRLIAVDVPRLVDNIARNMKEVASASAQQQATAFAAGFKALTDVVQLCMGLLNRVDQRLEQLELAAPEPEPEPEPQETGAGRNELVQAALMQALGAAGGSPPPGAPSGAAAPVINPAQVAQILSLVQQHLGAAPAAATEHDNGG